MEICFDNMKKVVVKLMNKSIPIVCGSVATNPSPFGVKLHNSGYSKLGLSYTYIALGSQNIEEVIDIVRKLPFRGLGISMPFKQTVIKHLDSKTEAVEAIGACNTIVNEDGKLTGHNTDWLGALAALDEVYDTKLIKRALIIGAGGVARAIGYALKQRQIEVYVSARSEDQRKRLVDELKLYDGGTIRNQGSFEADLVINATPDSSFNNPVDLSAHPKAKVVFDVVFHSRTTPLIQRAKELGLTVVPGWKMLLYQTVSQFELYTKIPAPIDVLSKVLEESLPE